MGCALIFSCLFAEDAAYLRAYIRNFLNFTDDDCGLVVNCGLRVDAEELNEISDRVLVQHAVVPRRKVGPTLLIGHLENFEAACAKFGEFEFFCSIASNSLFVDSVRLSEVREEMQLEKRIPKYSTERLPDNWHWPRVISDPLFLPYMAQSGVTELSCSQIEGLCLHKDDWARVAAHLPFLEAGAHRELTTFPYEEVLPMTILAQSPRPRFCILCHNFWERQKTSGGAARVEDLLLPPSSFAGKGILKSDPVFAMKWFRRTVEDPMTAFLCSDNAPVHLTMLRKLAASPHGEPVRRFYDDAFRTVLSGWVTKDLFSSISESVDAGSEAIVYDAAGIRADRQRAVIATIERFSTAAYVFFEGTRVAHDVKLQILRSGEAFECRVSCRPTEQDDADFTPQESSGTLVGYVYFPSHILSWGRILFAAEATLREGAHSPNIGRFTHCYKGAYGVAERLPQPPPLDVYGSAKHGQMYSAVIDPAGSKDVCYIGIPIVCDTQVDYKVSVYHSDLDAPGPRP